MFTSTVLFIFLTLSAAQNDPLQDFCRIHGHQTAVVDRRLYIDGGYVNWSPISPESQNYTNTWLRYGDLDEDHEGFPQQYTLSRNSTIPSVDGGVMWPDTVNKVIYQYGGEYGNDQPEDFRLWFYDIIYDTWNISDASTTDIRRPSWGAGIVAQDKGKGYYYGGWLTNASVPGYQDRTPLKNMIVYDIIKNSFSNRTGPDDIPRAEGSMVYVPAGDGGFAVYFGGIQFPNGLDNETALPMTDILLYDIANEKWYNQKASGEEIPGDRRRFCAGAAWTEDRSSYNIYLFGGASVGEGPGYGDVWILSLPSFTWIKFFPLGDEEGGPPHHSLSCDVIGNSQMIIMGGTFPNTSECDIPANYGQHGLDLGKANDEGAKWALFNPNNTVYQVPTEIAKVIGGAPTGGATALAPSGGWDAGDLSILFERHHTPTSRTATRYIPPATGAPKPKDSSSDGPDKKTIIGAAVGGGVGGLLLIAAVVLGCCLCLRRRRRKIEANSTPAPGPQEPHLQPIDNFDAPPPMSAHQDTFRSQRSTQYALSPQGSPPPPSDHTWSQYGFSTPVQTTSPTLYDKDGQFSPYHGRSPSHQSMNNSSLRSSAMGYYDQPSSPPQELPNIASPPPTQEMPNVRSPLGFNADQHSQVMQSPGVDPYFAQHPPRG